MIICVYIYIMYASGQDAQGHLWHGSDWTATNQSDFHTSGLSCKLDTFSKPRLRKMLFSASECCSNRMAPTSSSFEGKSLKKKMTWMVENRNQKHEESILIILRNRKQLTSLVFSLSPFALDFKGRQSQNLSASGLRLSSSSTHWTLSNHSPVGPFSWTHRISTLLWTWAAFKARKAQCRFSSQPLSTRTSVSILSKTLRLSVIRQPGWHSHWLISTALTSAPGFNAHHFRKLEAGVVIELVFTIHCHHCFGRSGWSTLSVNLLWWPSYQWNVLTASFNELSRGGTGHHALSAWGRHQSCFERLHQPKHKVQACQAEWHGPSNGDPSFLWLYPTNGWLYTPCQWCIDSPRKVTNPPQR